MTTHATPSKPTPLTQPDLTLLFPRSLLLAYFPLDISGTTLLSIAQYYTDNAITTALRENLTISGFDPRQANPNRLKHLMTMAKTANLWNDEDGEASHNSSLAKWFKWRNGLPAEGWGREDEGKGREKVQLMRDALPEDLKPQASRDFWLRSLFNQCMMAMAEYVSTSPTAEKSAEIIKRFDPIIRKAELPYEEGNALDCLRTYLFHINDKDPGWEDIRLAVDVAWDRAIDLASPWRRSELMRLDTLLKNEISLNHSLNSILTALQESNSAGPFKEPVNPEEVPVYYTLITNPMDLLTVSEKLVTRREYQTVESFIKDILLIVRNCRYFNEKGTDFELAALGLERELWAQIGQVEEWKHLDPKEFESTEPADIPMGEAGEEPNGSHLRTEGIETTTQPKRSHKKKVVSSTTKNDGKTSTGQH